ncbi:hypothetical protein ACH44C_09355 [Streptomyces purpureus]|uniref:hypothetical protein n=1 Tax=Streptomyces purpureus TaxID=1951 RepID=UPI00379E6D6B
MDDFWFRLPPGFGDLDLGRSEQLEVSDPQAPGVAEARALLHLMDCLGAQGVMHAACGAHESDDGGVCVSLLCLSEVDTGSPTATVAAAQCALTMVNGRFGSVLSRDLVSLSCGRPAALATYHLPPPSEELLRSAGLPVVAGTIFQARLAVARPHGPRVIVIDLTTTALDLADAYTDILLGIGQTVSFVDPDAASEEPRRSSRLLEVLL